MKITGYEPKITFLKEFDTIIQKFDLVSLDHMPKLHKIRLLKKAIKADTQLISRWTAVETSISKRSLGTALPYVEYMEYLVSHAEKLEESSMVNFKKANVVETNFMDSYIPEDMYYDKA